MSRLMAGIGALAFASSAFGGLIAAGPASTEHVFDARQMSRVNNPGEHRLLTPSQGGAAAYGDTYGLELLGQNSTTAFFLTSIGGSAPPADTNYDGIADNMGQDLAYGNPAVPDHVVQSVESEFTNVYGQTYVTVQVASVDGFDLLPAGVNGGAGGLITTLRMDMGRSAAGTNQLSPLPVFDIIRARVVLFIDGAAVLTGDFTPSATNSGAGQLAQTGLKDLITVTNAAGVGIDAVQFQYIIGTFPEPTSALLLLVGAAGMLRRR